METFDGGRSGSVVRGFSRSLPLQALIYQSRVQRPTGTNTHRVTESERSHSMRRSDGVSAYDGYLGMRVFGWTEVHLNFGLRRELSLNARERRDRGK